MRFFSSVRKSILVGASRAGSFTHLLRALTLGALLLATLAACGSNGDQAGDGAAEPAVRIVVSILPQKYFVERIGGDHVAVTVMVPPGAEPHTYEPRPEQLRRVSEADAYLRVWVEFEDAWMERIASANRGMRIVDTAEGIERMPLIDSHAREGAQTDREGLDPHIWLSPSLVKVQARTIHRALVDLDPAHQIDYDQNLAAFETDIDALIEDIKETLAGVTQRTFMTFHPSWGYFADEFGLEMLSIEVGGQEPSATEMATIIREAKEEGIRVVFAEPQFSRAAAETIAQEIGGEVLLIDPLDEDWLDNMREVAETLAQVLGGTS